MKKNGFIAIAISISLAGMQMPAQARLLSGPLHTWQQRSLKQIPMPELFKKLETKYKVKFFYSNADWANVQVDETILDNQSLANSLNELKKNYPVDFKLQNGVVTVRKTKQVNRQQEVLQGTVTDQQGQPVKGATIQFMQGENRVASDSNGQFKINFPQHGGRTLLVSYTGYQTYRQAVASSQKNISVQLYAQDQNLDEVVVIGYGKQSRAKVIGAVSKVDAKTLEKVSAASFEQQLAGKVAGVTINQSNGLPGAGAQIVIRGRGTLTAGADPLIVVDGFPLTEGSTLNSINPSDIADINILKDAASAAIYGSRAANGVILVTTKQGKGRTKIDFDVYTGIQEQASGVKLVDAYQFAQYLTEGRNWGYVSKDPANRSENDPNSIRVTKKIDGKNIDGRELFLDYLTPYLNGEQGLTNTNWMDLAFRAAPMTNYNLSISGASDKTSYYASMGYFDQQGVVVGSDVQRLATSISLNTKLNDRLQFGINLKPSFTNQNAQDQSSRSNGVLALMPLSFPFYTAYNADGSLNISDQLRQEQRVIEGVAINGTPVENILATAQLVKNNNKRFKTFGNVFLNYEFVKNLTYKISLGGDYDTYFKDHFYPSTVGAYRLPAPRSDADANQSRANLYNYLVENTLNYNLQLGKHGFNLLVGHTFQKEQIDELTVTGTGFLDDNIRNIAGASSFNAVPKINAWTLESYLSRFQYDYDSKYLFSAAIRRDGSSRFGLNNRWGNFPSLSAGWIISSEDFFPQNSLFTFAKLSASWGKTGNNQIGNYGSQALVTQANYVNGNALAPGYITTTAPNPNLGWEIATSNNIGLDLGFFKNRLNASFAYYKTNTRDLLLDVPVPQQTGYSEVLANVGEMENRGLEMQVSGNNFHIGGITVGFNANATTYQNKVLALGPGQTRIATGTDQNFITQVGGSIAEIYGYTVAGVYKTQAEIDESPHLDGTLTGDYRVVDTNGDGVIDSRDKVSKGDYVPDLTYGFGTDLQYKSFHFSFDFVGLYGRTLMDADMSSLTESGEGFGLPTTYYFENRYHPVNNPNGFLGQPNYANFSNSRKLLRSSVVTERNNGDYFRLRNIRIGYDLSENWLQRLNLSQLNIYLSANNVFTKTKFRSWNPDGSSTNILESGFNNGSNYPIAKTFVLGLKVTY